MSDRSKLMHEHAEGDVVVVRLLVRTMTSIEVAVVERRLMQYVAEATTPMLVLDFARVRHVTSECLGMIRSVCKQVEGKDGQLRLSGLAPDVQEVLVITQLIRRLHIDATVEDALKSIHG